MRYLAPDIDEKRKQQYIAPRAGVDIPYWNKYFTNAKPFFVKVTDSISGTVNTGFEEYFSPDDWDSTWNDYDGFGYYLINSDGSNSYKIKDINSDDEWIETEEDMPASATSVYYIAKYYESLITSCPNISTSSKRQGELARIGNINFSVANSDEATYESATFDYISPTIVEQLGGGDIIDIANIGKIMIMQHDDITYERTIVDIDTTTSYITFAPAIESTTSQIKCTVKTNNYLSDTFYDFPYIEGEDVDVYEYLMDSIDDTIVSYNYGLSLFEGKVQEISDITNSEVSFIGYDLENYTAKDTVGNLISENEDYFTLWSPKSIIGQVKPIVFGEHIYTNIKSSGAPTENNVDLVKVRYLGTWWDSGLYMYFLLSNHDGSSITNLYAKNSAGRFSRVLSTAVTETSGSDTLIKVAVSSLNSERYITLKDYYYANGEFDENDRNNVTLSDIGDSCNSDDGDNAQIIGQTAFENESFYDYDIEYNEYDNSVDNDNIISVDVKAYVQALVDTGSDPDDGGYFKINEIDTTNWNLSSFTQQSYGSTDATNEGIAEDVNVSFFAGNYDGLGTNDTLVCRLALVVKEITYKISDFETAEFYASCYGYEYNTWINNRTLNDTNPNGGFYNFTHYDDDNSGNTIQNPIGIIEAILRDSTFGMSLGNSDIDLDSFNRASTARADWELAFQIQSQEDSESLLEDLCKQSACVLYEREGRVACFAYDSSMPFTNNAMVFVDALLDADSNILDGATDFEIECYFQTPSDWSIGNPTLLSSETATIYGRLSIKSTGATLQIDTGASTATYNIVKSLSNNTNYKLTIKKIGATITYDFNGTEGSLESNALYSIYIDRVGALRTFISGFNFNGKIYNCKIWSGGDRNTGTLVCDLEAINEKFVDKSGTHYFTKTVSGAGDITFELKDEGIFDFYDTTQNGEFTRHPIINFKLSKSTDELVNKLIANYYYNNDTNNPQTTETFTDTTLNSVIEKTYNLNKISDGDTVDDLKDVIFSTNAVRAYECQFQTTASAIIFEKFDVVNIRHPLLRNLFSDMTSKKWLITSVETDTECMLSTITAVELL